MLITIIVMFVVMLLISVIFTEDIQALPLARQSQNYQAALQAADSGVEDYINRLDNISSYWSSTDPTNTAFSAWTPVAGSTVHEWYRYYADTSQTARSGTINLIVSGAAGQDPTVAGDQYAVRTIKQGIQVSGFQNFLYFTDHEVESPFLETGFRPWGSSDSYTTDCDVYAWQQNTKDPDYHGYGPDPICYNGGNGNNNDYIIYFGGGDVLNGPVFTNDGFHVDSNVTFAAAVTSTYNQDTSEDSTGVQYGGPGTYPPSEFSGVTPTFEGTPVPTGGWPTGHGLEPFPANNQNMSQDLGLDGGGCSYLGPITVTFNGATMTVSLGTGATASSPVAGVTCTGTNISYPPNGLIYDDNRTCTPTTCPGVCASGTCVYDAAVSVHGTVGDSAAQCTGASPPAACSQQVTIGSNNTIAITGNLEDGTASGNTITGSEVIGLSATNTITLPDNGAGQDETIDAAMVALNESIYYPGYDSGPALGHLNLVGSLAQENRGFVATFGSRGTITNGYVKNYNWDPRLQYLQPPFFTAPTLPTWERTTVAECNPASAPSAATC